MFDCTLLDKYGNTITNLTQWDFNITLYIEDHGFDIAPQFHFCNKNSEKALVVQSKIVDSETLSISIPNILLVEPLTIFTYVYLTDGESGKTVEYVQIPVRQRPQPDSFEYEDNTEIVDVKELAAEMRALISSVEISETQRNTAENTRISNENERIANENQRKSNEVARIDAENTRKTNETNRISAENTRNTNEETRESNEDARTTAETARSSAEVTRKNNENIRKTDEEARIEAETNRATAENTRIANEKIRQDQEAARQTNIALANNATTRANIAAKKCEDVVDGLNETVNKAVTDSEGYATLSQQYAQECEDTLNEINRKMTLTTFDVDEYGNLVYSDDSAYAFNVDENGNLNWSVE